MATIKEHPFISCTKLFDGTR